LIETGSIAPASYRFAALPTEPPANLTGITSVPGGIKITFTGSADYAYQIHRAAALENGNPNWVQVGLATTDAEGLGEFTDLNPTAGQGYYRAVRVEQGQKGLQSR
jgi:hypothetical protein